MHIQAKPSRLPPRKRMEPNNVRLDKSHQQRVLHHVAWANYPACPKIPSKERSHNLWPPQAKQKRPQVHKQHPSRCKNTCTPPAPHRTPISSQNPSTPHAHMTFFLKIIDLERKIYTDQTGRFPVTSSRGHKYLCCAYDYDSNTIHAEPMKTKTGTELMTTYQSIHKLLSERGLTPKLHILDNECPQVLKTFMNNV